MLQNIESIMAVLPLLSSNFGISVHRRTSACFCENKKTVSARYRLSVLQLYTKLVLQVYSLAFVLFTWFGTYLCRHFQDNGGMEGQSGLIYRSCSKVMVGFVEWHAMLWENDRRNGCNFAVV